jgi:nicotinamidase-related amidase
MPFDLDSVLDPQRCAVLLIDLQRSLMGDLSEDAVVKPIFDERGVLDNVTRLVRTGRTAGARIVHCTAEFRADLAGSQRNCPVLAAALKHPQHLVQGSAGAQVIPELGPEPQDLVVPRLHGLTAFAGTELDALLRNLDVRTVLVAGVSVNVGVIGTVLEAANLGYQVVVAADTVAGHPSDYSDAVVRHTLGLLATVTTSKVVVARWQST